jgi:chromosome partitioning protein
MLYLQGHLMATIIAVVSQKGGVGKSTIARLVAREYANAQWSVKIADLDTNQGTSYDWHTRRLQQDLKPEIAVERFRTVEQAARVRDHYDLLVLDGKPHSSAETLKMVEVATLAVLPVGLSIEDLKPQVLLAHELVGKGIPKERIVFALSRVGDSDVLLDSARSYVEEAGYRTLPGSIPEKIAYLKAAEEGRALTETRYPSLNERAAQVVQGIVDVAAVLEKGVAA